MGADVTGASANSSNWMDSGGLGVRSNAPTAWWTMPGEPQSRARYRPSKASSGERMLGDFQPIVTIDLRLDYLRPALKGETVIARCECYKLTRQVAFVRGTAHGGDPERPIAQAVGTFMLNP